MRAFFWGGCVALGVLVSCNAILGNEDGRLGADAGSGGIAGGGGTAGAGGSGGVDGGATGGMAGMGGIAGQAADCWQMLDGTGITPGNAKVQWSKSLAASGHSLFIDFALGAAGTLFVHGEAQEIATVGGNVSTASGEFLARVVASGTIQGARELPAGGKLALLGNSSDVVYALPFANSVTIDSQTATANGAAFALFNIHGGNDATDSTTVNADANYFNVVNQPTGGCLLSVLPNGSGPSLYSLDGALDQTASFYAYADTVLTNADASTDGSVFIDLKATAASVDIEGQTVSVGDPKKAYLVAKLSSGLKHAWHRLLQGVQPGSFAAGAQGIAVVATQSDTTMNIAGTSRAACDASTGKVALTRFDATGNRLWTRLFEGGTSGAVLAMDGPATYIWVKDHVGMKGLALDEAGTGYVIRVDGLGHVEWIQAVPQAGQGKLEIGPAGGITAGGNFSGTLGTPTPLNALGSSNDFVLYMK